MEQDSVGTLRTNNRSVYSQASSGSPGCSQITTTTNLDNQTFANRLNQRTNSKPPYNPYNNRQPQEAMNISRKPP